jgi:hypothetical protein
VDRADRIEAGVALLARLEYDELSMKAAMDRVELLSTDPAVQRAILDEAEAEGIIEREGGTVRPRADGTFVSFGSDVTVKEGEFSCRRCGSTITEGHFLNLDEREVGPFGSTCVKKVLGRD